MNFFCLVHQHDYHSLCHTSPTGPSENALSYARLRVRSEIATFRKRSQQSMRRQPEPRFLSVSRDVTIFEKFRFRRLHAANP